MNWTGVASKNCHSGGSIQCCPAKSPNMGKTRGKDKASAQATGAKPAQVDTGAAKEGAALSRTT